MKKRKKRRDIMKFYKIMSDPEDLTQISLFISQLLISFSLHAAPPLSRSFKMYFPLFPNSLSPPIYEPLHIIFHPSSFLYTSSHDRNSNRKSKCFLNINKCKYYL